MPIETTTVFRAGAFTTEPAPDWLRQAHELASDGRTNWEEALTAAIGSTPSIASLGEHASVQVSDWTVPGGGRYVEFWDVCGLVAEVWVADRAEWIAFYSAHVTPFLHTYAQIEIADQLERISTCLIAWARHGGGDHIDHFTGRSRIDRRQQRNFVKGLALTGAASERLTQSHR
jgi:hypothetical protein